MPQNGINRLKVVLAEEGRTSKWLADKMGKSTTTVSRWCTNEAQPSLETLLEISKILKIDVRMLINSTKS